MRAHTRMRVCLRVVGLPRTDRRWVRPAVVEALQVDAHEVALCARARVRERECVCVCVCAK